MVIINNIVELDKELEGVAEQWIVAIIEGQDDTFFKKRFESVNNKHVDADVKSSVEALTENLESTKSRGSNIIAQSSTIVYRKSTNLKD